MKNFTKIQRIAIAILLVTKGVKSEELEPLGITKSQADSWARYLLDKHITFQDALDIYHEGDTEVSINHLLTLCLDQRFFTKSPKSTDKLQKD